MKLHDNNGTSYIINDTDIKMTGDEFGLNAGYTLKAVLNDHSKKIEKLESNVKWMYRYGALGSGGSGQGGGSTSKMTVFIYKDGTQPISPGTRIMYPGEGYYTFKVEVHGGGSDTFLIKYYYNNGRTLSRVVSQDNEFTSTESLKLEGNNELTITVKNQSTGEFYVVNDSPNLTFQYVTSAYNITANYVKGDDVNGRNYERFTANDNIIFLSDVVNTGLMIGINFNIAVQLMDDNTHIEYNDWQDRNVVIENNTMTISWVDENNIEQHITRNYDIKLKSNSAGVMYLPLADDIKAFLSDNSNASFKQLNVKIYSQLADDIEETMLGSFNFNDNLIPNGLFLNVRTSAGKLYNNMNSASTASDENQMTSGDILFKVTPYNGSLVATRLYQLSVDIYNDNDELISSTRQTTLNEQKESDIILSIAEHGVKKIVFNLVLNGNTTQYIYYIKIKDFISSFEWYPNIYVSSASSETEVLTPYYTASYKRNFDNINISSDDIFVSSGNNIQMTSNDVMRTINFNYDGEYNNTQLIYYDLLFALGIQYSSINNTKIPILSINASGSTATTKTEYTIFLYQNKVSITTSTTTINSHENISISSKDIQIFLPIEDTYEPAVSTKYHLFNIYKRYENSAGTNYWKSISTYIDGTLEGLLSSFVSDNVRYESMTLYPGNYSINLFELSLFNHTSNSTDELNERTWLTDIDINRYFRAYNEKIVYRQSIYQTSDFSLFDRFSQFNIDENNRIIVKDDAAMNIANETKCAVMQLFFDDLGNGIGEYKEHNVDNFMQWFERSYGENENAATHIPVTVQYSSGDGNGLRQIFMPDTQDAAVFSIDIQGSSTKTFKCKNLELYGPSSSQEYDYIYSPNICKDTTDPEYKSSFLPETSFTLKADAVDSSHTNNNAIGKFVNDNTTQFANAVSNDNQHGTHHSANIKNALIGFPVLLFMHTRYELYTIETDEKTGQYVDNYYFLGIYNFNLGRKSAYNLGYKDIANIEPLIDAVGAPERGFAIYKIDAHKNVQINNIVGAEIQGNNAFFDFSQYTDNRIMFDTNFGMWGDFIGIKPENEIQTDLKKLCKDVAFAGGYVFNIIGKQMSESLSDRYGYAKLYSKKTIDDNGKTVEWVPNYHWQAEYVSGTGTEINYNYTRVNDNGDLMNLRNLILQYTDENNEENIPRINFTSVSEYYTTMMAMGLVDSPMKNLNVKSWNSGKTFYAAFYDMDTGLGKNNAGTYINYFAFSDFWESRWERLSGHTAGTLQQVEITRDYSPESFEGDETGSSFFDVPSTYLFAVAKYSKAILSAIDPSNSDEYKGIFDKDPSNIWGDWRNKTGCLRNAKYFMETYFNDHLKDVPEEAFNFNYRYKYLVKNNNNTGFDGINFIKFHGRGKAYTEYWLDSRLHILDAYFNLNAITDTIRVIDNVEIKASRVDDEHKPTSNEDVYVLQDAFSGSGTPLQYTTSSNGTLVITAKDYAPLILEYPQSKQRYLFPSDGSASEIQLNFVGNQSCLFGGSKMWTSISSIAPFISQGESFSMYSKYISTIIGTTRQCNSWTFDTPSLRTLKLTSPGYSNDISFESQPSAPSYQNLDEIDISTTKINLSLSNIPLRTLKAVNMQAGAKLVAIECNRLENVELSGEFETLQLSSWNNVSSLPTGGKLTCKVITITNDTQRFPDASLIISNNTELNTLNISGFSHVYVSACPKLKEIVFNEIGVPNLKTLDVQMPSYNSEMTFTIGSDENVVDLSRFDNLSTLRLSNTSVKDIKLPTSKGTLENDRRKITLLPRAFNNCKNLETIQNETYNDLYITGDGTFFNCGAQTTNGYRLIKYGSAEISNIYIDEQCTTLKDTFANNDGKGWITYDTASTFLTNRCTDESVNNVTNIDNMFKNNSIDYDYTSKYNEYLNKSCSLPLYGFINCISASDVFSSNNVNFFNRYMFENADKSKSLFMNMTNLSLVTMCNTFAYGTIDMLYPFINKTISIDFRQQSNITIYSPKPLSPRLSYTVLDVNRIFVSDVENIYPSKLTAIRNFSLSPTWTSVGGFQFKQKMNFTGLFDNDKSSINEYVWTAANETGIFLNNFMNQTYTIESFDDSSLNKLFCNIVPSSILNSFGSLQSLQDNDILNIYTMFNWEIVKDKTYNLFSEASSGQANVVYGGLSLTKKCTYENFVEIWTNLIHSENLTGISSIFTDSIIIDDNWSNKIFKLTDDTYENASITTVPLLFKGMKLMDSTMENEYPIDITSSLFRNIKNLVYVPFIFEGTFMKHAIPFDIFAKRKIADKKTNCFVKISDTGTDADFVEGKIISYDYDNTIINMNKAFHNIIFSSKQDATFRNAYYNEYELNYASPNSDPSIRLYEYYVKRGDIFVNRDVPQPNEIEDIQKLWCDHQDVELIKTTDKVYVEPNIYKSTYSSVVGDYSKNGTYRNLSNFCEAEDCGFVVSPDIFRCCASSCNIVDALRYDRGNNADPVIMTGMMPPSIFKTDYLRVINFTDTFTGLNVSPIEMTYYDTDIITVAKKGATDTSNMTTQCQRHNTYYQYILDSFTDRDILTNSFNFMLLLPSSHSTYHEAEYIYEEHRYSQMFFMFSDKSISTDVIKMSTALPSDYNRRVLEDYDADHMHYFYKYDNGIYFNIMYSFSDIEMYDSETDTTHVETVFMTGIDKKKFKYLLFDSLISSDIAKIYRGNILSFNNSWSISNMSGDGAYVFYQVGGNNTGYIGLSANAILQAEYTNRGWYPRVGNGYNINKGSLPVQFEYNNPNIGNYWAGYNWVPISYEVYKHE